MINWLKSYGFFNRTERMGIAALLAIVCVLIGIRVTLRFFVHPDFNESDSRRLSIAWDSFKAVNLNYQLDDSLAEEQLLWLDKPEPGASILPDSININLADSSTLVRLKGVGPSTAGKIVQWRRVNGKFRCVDDLLKVRHIPDATFAVIKKHLRV